MKLIDMSQDELLQLAYDCKYEGDNPDHIRNCEPCKAWRLWNKRKNQHDRLAWQVKAGGKMNYPDRNAIIDALLESARKAAVDANVDHPQDIADAMLNAIELGWPVITYLNENGHLK